MRKHTIKAVHEKDLVQLLENLGLYDLMANNELRCGLCKCVVNLDNLLSIYPFQEEVKVCCKKSECYSRMLMEMV